MPLKYAADNIIMFLLVFGENKAWNFIWTVCPGETIPMKSQASPSQKNKIKYFKKGVAVVVDLFVLRFYGPVNPMGSCWAQSVYLTTRLLDRLSPLSG